MGEWLGDRFFLAGRDSVRLNYAFRTIPMTSQAQFRSEEAFRSEPSDQKKPIFFRNPAESGGIPAELPTKALGYQQIIVPQQRGDAVGATSSGQAVGKTGNTEYTSDDVCTVMTFSGVRDPVDCQEIWTIFGEKKRNVDICRKYLMTAIQKYAWDHRATIDTAVYLEQETMKAIVDLKFNPGEGTAYVQSAAKGLSLLCCRARTNQETEEIKEREAALEATHSTRVFDDYLKYIKGNARQPASNFYDLKQNIATFMALLWVLFGDKCDYFCNVLKIYKILEMPEVVQLRSKFSPEICRRITWAIIDDGRSFFNTVITPQEFSKPGMIVFPMSFLHSILESIRFCNPIQHGNFPQEWLASPRRDREGATRGRQG